MDKDIIIKNLLEENRLLRLQVLELTETIRSLKLEIQQLKTRRNINNSSIPSSVDLSRKNKSLRTPSGNKHGGQSGHEGSTLKMVENPTEVHELMPEFCNHCGKDLTKIMPHFESKRQIIEILNSDRWLAQLNIGAKGHQLCTSHLLRNLNFLIESENTIWAEEMKPLLIKAIDIKKEYPELGNDNQITKEIENGMTKLLATPLDKSKVPKTLNIQKAFTKSKKSIFQFLDNTEPPDNNSLGRAIRNLKVKQTISGQFKTEHNALWVLRSIIDTCKKNKVDVLEALNLIEKNSMPQVVPE